MADTYEKDLAQKSSLTVNDFIRVVGTDNVSYKQLVSDVAKKIIENYTGSSLAGSSQSVKSALDALNSKTSGLFIKKYESHAGTAVNIGVIPRATLFIFANDNGGRSWLALISIKNNGDIETNIIVHDSIPEYDPTFSFTNNILTVNCHAWETIICLSTKQTT